MLTLRPPGKFEPGEAEINRHLALALFLQPVGIDAGQCTHEGRFAVIDVPGGADDEGALFGRDAGLLAAHTLLRLVASTPAQGVGRDDGGRSECTLRVGPPCTGTIATNTR